MCVQEVSVCLTRGSYMSVTDGCQKDLEYMRSAARYKDIVLLFPRSLLKSIN